ncbi:tri1 [Symbiodinium sp. CCMP2592]|nr:tri1 [Symbiodinium sp. CCMP2592]
MPVHLPAVPRPMFGRGPDASRSEDAGRDGGRTGLKETKASLKPLVRDVINGLVPVDKDREIIQIRKGRGGLFGKQDDLNYYSVFQEVPLSLKEKLVEAAACDDLYHRAMGCMQGMAVGDSLGHPFEFLPVQDRPVGPHFDFERFEFVGASNTFRLKPGQWTDDAAMGLCMADSLLMRREFDGSDMRIRFWCWWNRGYNNAFRKDPTRSGSVGLGGNIAKSLTEISYLLPEETPSPAYKAATEDAGNGSLMRFAPIAIYYHAAPMEEVLDFARQSSYTTHPGIIAAEACSLLAFLIIRALKRQGEENQMTARDFLDKVTAEYLSVSGLENKSGWGFDQMNWLVRAKPIHATERCWDWRNPHLDIAGTLRARGRSYNGYPVSAGYFGSYSLDGLALALWSVYNSSSFNEAVVKSVNLLGDAARVVVAMPHTTSFVFVKFGEEPVRVILTHTPGMLLVNEGMPLLDMRNNPDGMEQALLALTVPQLRDFVDDYHLSGISMRGKTSKQDIVRQILARWDEVMAKVEAMVPDFRENVRAMTNQAQASTAGADVRPFSGVPHRLDGGYNASDAEETKEETPVMRLVVRPEEGSSEGAIVVLVFEGDTSTTIIEQMVPVILKRSTTQTNDTAPDCTTLAMMLKFVKVRDNTMLDSTTPIQTYFDSEWGEVRLVKRTTTEDHDLISEQFWTSGHLWAKTSGKDDSHAKMEDGVVLKAKSESTKGCLTVKVGDSIRLYFNYEPADRIKDVLESMETKFGLKVSRAEGAFKLKYLATGSFFEDWEPVHATVAEDEDGGRAELVVSLRGGGKTVKKTNLKKSLVAEMKENLQEQARTADVSMIDTVGETVATAKHDLTALFASADADPRAVLSKLIGNASVEVLGNSKGTSPLLEMLGKGRRDTRLNDVGNAVMKANFARLYDLHAEVDGLTETCELTWDVIVNQAFMKDDGSFDFSGLRRLIEDAIVIKASRGN